MRGWVVAGVLAVGLALGVGFVAGTMAAGPRECVAVPLQPAFGWRMPSDPLYVPPPSYSVPC